MKLLVVAYSARALAASAVRAGYTVVAADYCGDWDLRQLCPGVSVARDLGLPWGAEALWQACSRLDFDAVVYGGALENYPEVLAPLAARAMLCGNPKEVVNRVRDWRELARAVRAAGLPFPRTLAGRDARPANGCWVRKRLRSAGGAGVVPWQPGEPVPDGCVLQEYVPGTPCSALFVANGRQARLVAVTEQLVGAGEFGARLFQYVGNVVPLDPAVAPPDLAEQLARLANHLVSDFGLVGLWGVDFILGSDGPVVVEVNPRYTAAVEVVEAATGQALLVAHLEAVAGSLPDVAAPPVGPPYWGKAVVYARRPGRWRLEPPPPPWLRDVPYPGDLLPAGVPVCTVLAQGPTREACLALLRERAEAVRQWCEE